MNLSWIDQVRVSPCFYRSYWTFAKIQFPVFSSADFFDIELKFWYLKIFWLNTDQVLLLSSLTFFYTSYCPLLKLSFPDFSMQSFEILTLNRLSSSWSVFIGVMPPKYLLGPVGDMYCLSNTFRMLVQLKSSLISQHTCNMEKWKKSRALQFNNRAL